MGIRSGDRIEYINDKDVTKMTFTDARRSLEDSRPLRVRFSRSTVTWSPRCLDPFGVEHFDFTRRFEDPETFPPGGKNTFEHLYKRPTMSLESPYAYIAYDNGDSYRGPLDAFGRQSGNGDYQFADGRHFQGSFKNGLMHGRGRLSTEYGIFEGEMKNAYPDGAGTWIYPNGDVLEGFFTKGKADGVGVLFSFSEQVSTVGFWKMGQKRPIPKFKFDHKDSHQFADAPKESRISSTKLPSPAPPPPLQREKWSKRKRTASRPSKKKKENTAALFFPCKLWPNIEVLVASVVTLLIVLTHRLAQRMAGAIVRKVKQNRWTQWVALRYQSCVYIRKPLFAALHSAASTKKQDSAPIWSKWGERSAEPLLKKTSTLCCVICKIESGLKTTLLACQGCHKYYYCSKECQSVHWKYGHRKECNKINDKNKNTTPRKEIAGRTGEAAAVAQAEEEIRPQQINWKRADEPPSHLCCPITADLYVAPVLCSDGETYEKEAIVQWINARQRDISLAQKTLKIEKKNIHAQKVIRAGVISPLHGGKLDSHRLIPNRIVSRLCEEWREQRR